ncbi:7-carboxy-7-deazaguanine synthase QueE [Streptomyces misionensis]|uniref:7-carboxy-7-deazaguanine synthase QueE n=1 Tax=Streptomyces misionensis TaxID=67331 RepID=UPI0033C7A9F8
MKELEIAGTVMAGFLPLQEVFGPVPQGEGPYTGRCACFIRLGRCNLHCPPCDSKRTWDTSRYNLAMTCPPRTAEEIVEMAEEHGAGSGITVISGGEPLLWQRTAAWQQVLAALPGDVHIETNGTVFPNAFTAERVTHFSVSPKIGRMGAADPAKRRIRPEVLGGFAELARAGQAAFKFVAANTGEVEEAAQLVRESGIPHDKVWIMPMGANDATWTATGRDIVEQVMGCGFNFTGRLHLTLGVR